jgi:hypothetical protein
MKMKTKKTKQKEKTKKNKKMAILSLANIALNSPGVISWWVPALVYRRRITP